MTDKKPPPRILSIAGSDSGGGAGIQADIKTITMLGGYAMTAITAVTAQNTRGVQGITPLTGDFVAEQIESCLSDFGADAIKLGMLQNIDIIESIATVLDQLDEAKDVPLVLDPVMVATSGARLLEEEAVAALQDRLFGRATLLTPNLPELEILTQRTIKDTLEAAEAAGALSDRHDCFVLAKGGHAESNRIVDILTGPDGYIRQFDDERIDTRHTHGTGCTLSAAIATLLGHQQPLEHAVRLARRFTREAIERAPGFGDKSGPLGHHAVRMEG